MVQGAGFGRLLFSIGSIDLRMPEKSHRRSRRSIYLFPECSFEHELLEHLEDACAKIFEQELESWDRLEETWPTDRSFEAFRRWFDYSISLDGL